jgi:hypothetical protein
VAAAGSGLTPLRQAAQFNVLGVKQLESIASLVLSLLALAGRDGLRTGKKGLFVAFEDSQVRSRAGVAD